LLDDPGEEHNADHEYDGYDNEHSHENFHGFLKI
jgi:hypothetical protein